MRKAVVAIFLLLPICLPAQQNIEAGLLIGASNYQGDLSEAFVEFAETNIGFGGFLRYHLNSKIKIQGGIYRVQISGNDANADGALKTRGWSFESSVYEMSLHVEYHPIGKNRVSNTGIFRKQVSPYIATGLGQAISYTKLNAGQDQDLFPEEGYKNTSFSAPIVLGVRADLNEHFAVGLELGTRITFSDYIDSVSKNGNDKKNDWYSLAGITLSYFFGGIIADQFQFR